MLLGAVAAGLALPACGSDGDGDALRVELDGTARVGDRTLGPGTHDLAVGDVLDVEEGSGLVSLPGDATVEVREGSRLEVGATPSLLEGDALLVGEGELDADGTTVALDGGAARVGRSTGVVIAVYEGRADVRSGGRSLPDGLPALRQVVVPDAGLLPRRPAPLAYADDPDPWDRRWLGAAIDLGVELDARAVGLSAAGDGSGVVRALLTDGADAAFVRADGGPRSAGEAAVGAAIAATGQGGSPPERLAAAFAFRDEGARWGLVALDQQAEREPLLAALDGALDDAAPVLFAAPPASGGSSSPSRRPTSPPASPSPSPSTGPSPSPPPASPPPPSPPPPTSPPPPPPPPTTPPPTTPLPTVPPLPPPPTTPPGSATTPLEDLLGGVLDGL